MKKYTITALMGATFGVGTILKLTAKQVKPRAASLVEVKPKGCFEVVAPVTFKLGEEIGLAENVNKAVLMAVASKKASAPKETTTSEKNGSDATGDEEAIGSESGSDATGDEEATGSEGGSETDAPAS